MLSDIRPFLHTLFVVSVFGINTNTLTMEHKKSSTRPPSLCTKFSNHTDNAIHKLFKELEVLIIKKDVIKCKKKFDTLEQEAKNLYIEEEFRLPFDEELKGC